MPTPICQPQTGRRFRVFCVGGAALAVAVGGALASPPAGASLAAAQAPTPPLCAPAEGRPVLRLTNADPQRQAVCTLAGLHALPQRSIVTSLPSSLGWAGTHQWQGVSLKMLADRLGAKAGSAVQLKALNDYVVSVPWSDLERYDPIVAHRRNGEPLSVRENGPLMLIYPFDNHPELQSQQYLNRSIWQLHAIAIK